VEFNPHTRFDLAPLTGCPVLSARFAGLRRTPLRASKVRSCRSICIGPNPARGCRRMAPRNSKWVNALSLLHSCGCGDVGACSFSASHSKPITSTTQPTFGLQLDAVLIAIIVSGASPFLSLVIEPDHATTSCTVRWLGSKLIFRSRRTK